MTKSLDYQKKRRYDNVLFDADDTLLDFKRSEKSAIAEALGSFGLSYDESVLLEYSAINQSFWKLLELGKIEKSKLKHERFRAFCERFKYDVPYVQLAERYMECLSTKSYLIDGAKEICERLSGECKLYIITNGIESIQRPRFSASGLEKYFSGVFISDLMGYEKPDIRFFENMEKTIGGIDKKRTLIVGDSLSSDMKGGLLFGVDTCLFNPRGKDYPEELNIKYSVSSLDLIENIVFSENQ